MTQVFNSILVAQSGVCEAWDDLRGKVLRLQQITISPGSRVFERWISEDVGQQGATLLEDIETFETVFNQVFPKNLMLYIRFEIGRIKRFAEMCAGKTKEEVEQSIATSGYGSWSKAVDIAESACKAINEELDRLYKLYSETLSQLSSFRAPVVRDQRPQVVMAYYGGRETMYVPPLVAETFVNGKRSGPFAQ